MSLETEFKVVGTRLVGNQIIIDVLPKDDNPETPKIPVKITSIVRASHYHDLQVQFDSRELYDTVFAIAEGDIVKKTGSAPVTGSNILTLPGTAGLSNGSYSVVIAGPGETHEVSDKAEFKIEDAPNDLPACNRGPTIGSIFDVSTSGFSYQFDGDGISLIKERFAGKTHESTPTSNIIRVSVSLEPGSYFLEIEGGHCKSPVSTKPFTVPGVVDPGEPGEPVDPSLGVVAKTDTRFMNLSVKKASDGTFLISDSAELDFPSNYNIWYIFDIQKQVFKTDKPLKDYKWIGSGMLSVEKRVYRKDVQIEIEANNFNNGWGGRDRLWSTSYDGQPCLGGQALLFLGYDHTVPNWKGKSTAPEWSIKAPNMRLAPGKVMSFHAVLAKEAPIDMNDEPNPGTAKNPVPQNRIDKGETHLDDWGKYRNIDPSIVCDRTVGLAYMGLTPENCKTKPNGEFDDDPEKLYQAGFNWAPKGISCKEANEGRIWITHNGHHQRRLMEGVRDRAIRDGIKDPIYMSGYGAVGFSGLGLNFRSQEEIQLRRRMYSMSKDDIRRNFQLFNALGDSTNTYNIKYYGAIAADWRVQLDHIVQVELIKKAGYKALGFPGNLKEILDHLAYDLGALWEQDLPGGGQVVTRHIFRPGWTDMFNHGVLMMYFGDGFTLWDAAGTIGVDPNFVGDWGENSFYKNGGKKTPTPAKNVGYYPAVSMHAYDALYSGAAFYNSFSETEGGKTEYVDHEIGGVKYYAEKDGSSAMSAWINEHGIANVRTLNGKKTLLFYHPGLGNEKKTLKVQGFKDHEIVGNKVYMFKE